MKTLAALIALCLLAACASVGDPSRLEEGEWTGGLSPMNHPEMVTPLSYDVKYRGDDLHLLLRGPGGTEMPAREVKLDEETLRFVFDEPEEGVPLRCALAREANGRYEGRCTDAEGKWARFTMVPPAG